MVKQITIGSRRKVWNGTAKRTPGGLTKSDLMMSHGRIVSRSKHFSAKKEMRLLKHGYGAKKGKFGAVKTKKRGHRGGMPALNPADLGDGIAGQGITVGNAGSANVQLLAGMAGGRRRKSRRHRGGSGMASLGNFGSASWAGDGEGLTNYGNASTDVQIEAGMAGGRRRRRRHRGGTTKPFPPQSMGAPLNRALGA